MSTRIEHTAHAPGAHERYIVVPQQGGWVVYRSTRKRGIWYIELSAGEWFPTLGSAINAANVLARREGEAA